VFGIDDEVLSIGDENLPSRGNVIARVVGDGKVLWEDREVRGGEPPVRVGPLPVEGVRVLVLEVDPGEDPLLDSADWADPILVR
jgi:hypothetical protein